MNLLTTRNFNGIQLDCYEADNPADDFWATREQIGRLLGYSDPADSIRKIHKRNQERLDKFSRIVQVANPTKQNYRVNDKLKRGGQIDPSFKNLQTATVYNFRGLLEICRWSNQPKANDVMDFLWGVAEDIRKHGMYISDKVQELYKSSPESFKLLLDKYVTECDKNRELQKTIDAERPFSILGHMVLALPDSMTVKDAADLLAQHGIDIGQNRFFKRLRDDGWVCRRKGKQWNKPTKKALDKGFLNTQIENGFNTVTMILPKGLQFFSDLFTSEKYPLLVLLQGETED